MAGALCLNFLLAACATTQPPKPNATPSTAAAKKPSFTPPPLPPLERTVITPEKLPLILPSWDEMIAPHTPPYYAMPWVSDHRFVCISTIMTDMNGAVLMEKNADMRRAPASVTKVMTMILMFDAIRAGRVRMEDTITLSARAAGMQRTNMALSPGARISVEMGLKALAVHSANDVASAFAEHLAGGDETRFAGMMNDKAHAIGMTHTHFRNASGLPDPAMATTARDLARMSRYLIHEYPREYELFFGIRGFGYRNTRYTNHNRSLHSYGGMDGIKTGFTRAAMFNVALSAERPEGRLVTVLMGCPNTPVRTAEGERLMDKGFRMLRWQNPVRRRPAGNHHTPLPITPVERHTPAPEIIPVVAPKPVPLS